MSDIHMETAKELFGVEEISPEQRRCAKNINYNILYSGGECNPIDSLRRLESYDDRGTNSNT